MIIYAMIYDTIIYDYICNDILFDIKKSHTRDGLFKCLVKKFTEKRCVASCTKNGDMSTLIEKGGQQRRGDGNSLNCCPPIFWLKIGKY